MIIAERAARLAAETRLAAAANAQAQLSNTEALIAHLKLEIEKLRRTLYGSRSERSARLLDQLELQLEELEAAATEDELAAERAAERTQTVRSFRRKRPVRQPWPADIERERIVIDAPTACACCGGSRLSKLGEDITETLEEIPRRFKVIETVREKFTCRDCEKITQPPAPFHATPRGFIGPQLLATILFDKFGMHTPLNRQCARFRCEGIDLPLSTLADQVGHGAFVARPIFDLIEVHVLAAERLHGDDTKIPILAKGKTDTGRIWAYVRDDHPFGGQDCSFSWNRDPAAGLIFIQSGPRRRGSTLASDFVGGRDWNADCGDDRQDTTGVFFAWQADQGDLPRAAGIAQGRAEGHPVERDGVSV